ncbi:hypothetical protein Rt10032_c04g1764 [Rhodotorula toruloides]|uniref:Uncharacterized protein n=1 Tax=Rhodotorula toruloides TaxID=5286 RepID=A0A511KBI5_RHOTO|nr:hypothetical protein Rt10032_c04g1764 [Rhodotorula toruloides]
MAFPYFDPADFATVSPSASFASASTSSSTPWVDASSSPYSSSSAIALQASSSRTSLWTASSASDDEEQRCLDLLDQLEAEVTKLGGDGQKARKRASRIVGGRIAFPVEQGDVFGEFRGFGAKSFSNATSEAAAYRDLHSTRSTATLRPAHSPRYRRSRRLSFTQTDLADLDIDAILDAYSEDGSLPPISLDGPLHRPQCSPLRGVKSHAHLGAHDAYTQSIFQRPGTSQSSSLTLPMMSRNPTDELFPHRRVAPFPAIQRKKSVASVRSNPRARAPSDVPPPLPHLPPTPHHASSPSARSNRTFTSFARQSTYSNSSSGSYTPSSPNPSARSAAMRGSLSRDSQYSNSSTTSASSHSGNSFRWSVTTSSTAPSTEYSDNCSRRGSASGSVSSSACGGISSPTTRSAATMGRSPRFVAPVEESEDEQAQHDLPVSRRRPSQAQLRSRQRQQGGDLDDETRQRVDKGGLISWEDFANELDALPPPPPLPRQFLPSAPSRPTPPPAERLCSG